MKRKINLILTALLPVQIILIQILSGYPKVIEKIYSQYIFQKIALTEELIFGSLPFSVGDILYLAFAILLIRWLLIRIKSKFIQIKSWSLQVFSTLSVFYFLFHFLWGMNYYRIPLNEKLTLDREYKYEDLLSLTDFIILKSNQLQKQLSTDKNTAVDFNFSLKEINTLNNYSFDLMRFKSRKLKLNSKSSLFSFPLSYMGFSGYLNPLTNEAHLNTRLPNFKFPTLAAHEMAHQIGYAKENEANFIAVLATINHPNLHFKYAGYTFALQYLLQDIAQKDQNKAKELAEKLHPGVRKNYKEVQVFWKKHENPFEPAFKIFYKNFLKVNNQPEGMQSYNYVVGLLVNYYKREKSF